MSKDEIIKELSDRSGRYGELLIALMDRWRVPSLRNITAEQAQTFCDEIEIFKEAANP